MTFAQTNKRENCVSALWIIIFLNSFFLPYCFNKNFQDKLK